MDHLKTPPVWAEIRITGPGDVAIARQLAAQAAKRLFYSKARSKEAVLVASELAQNHIEHHTRNGLIRISGLILNDTPRLTIASLDEGPGIQDLKEAMKDGFSTSGGLGIGLGTVRRLSDSFHICSTRLGASPCPDIGVNAPFDTVAVSALLDHEAMTCNGVCALNENYDGMPAPPVDKQPDISALIRPYPGETYSGDAFYCRDDGRFCLMALIDATGHGRSAAEAAQRSIDAMAGLPPDADPDKVLDAADKALIGSDGASIHVLVLDRSLLKIKAAGVGNVNCILYLDGERRWPPLQPGVVGNSHLARKGSEVYDFGSDVLCFMYSDGVKPIPDIPSDVALKPVAADIWAQFFFNPEPSMEDDASLVTWKWRITKG
jgi:anti-sigma regulatory factor (Ser/Thr protein kinase)